MSAGGDGSPQLDLDAIERLYEGRPPSWVALVRRLQQENEELRKYADDCAHAMVASPAALERDALRGRVEELTEALQIEQDRSTMAFAHCAIAREELGEERWKRVEDAVHAWPESARVVPEKETP